MSLADDIKALKRLKSWLQYNDQLPELYRAADAVRQSIVDKIKELEDKVEKSEPEPDQP